MSTVSRVRREIGFKILEWIKEADNKDPTIAANQLAIVIERIIQIVLDGLGEDLKRREDNHEQPNQTRLH